jgi:hypothetical protein
LRQGARPQAADAGRLTDSALRSALTLVVLLGLLLMAVVIGVWAWQEIGDVEISRQGMIALGLGVVCTFLLGAGLMTLVFFSARHGYDERAHDAEKRFQDQWQDPGDDR